MNPVYYDVAFHLQSNGFGTLGDDLFGGEWGFKVGPNEAHEEVDKQILVLSSSGIPSDLKNLYEQPNLQIIVRGDRNETDLTIWRRSNEIFRFLLSLPETININGCIYKGFEEASGLLQLGKDTNQRFAYSFNLTTYRGV